MTTPLTIQQRRARIIANLKCNKPSIMAAKFADYARAQEAEKRGEEYVPRPVYTFLILEDGGEGTPFTLETIKKIIDEQGASTSLHLQEAMMLQRKEAGAKVQGICLKGQVRFWWDKLTRMLQPENWAETMVFYVEYLSGKVECEGAKMEALRVRRHFEVGELEEGGKDEGKHLAILEG